MDQCIDQSATIGVEKTHEINDILKTRGRYAAATTNLNPNSKPLTLSITQTLTILALTSDPNFFCTNNALFATGNKHPENGVSRLRMSLINCVLNADSGR